MPKLKLELDALEVDSFTTDRSDDDRGTVQAQSVNTEFCTQEYSCQINSYVCTETHYWAGCPTGGHQFCPVGPPES